MIRGFNIHFDFEMEIERIYLDSLALERLKRESIWNLFGNTEFES